MRNLDFGERGLLEEIDLIVSKVLEKRGILLTREEAVDFWSRCSAQWSAGWLGFGSHYEDSFLDSEWGRVLDSFVRELKKCQ